METPVADGGRIFASGCQDRRARSSAQIDPDVDAAEGAIADVPRVVCVPTDGTSLYRCLVARRDLRSWFAQHDSHGLGLSLESQRRDEAEAKSVRDSLIQ